MKTRYLSLLSFVVLGACQPAAKNDVDLSKEKKAILALEAQQRDNHFNKNV